MGPAEALVTRMEAAPVQVLDCSMQIPTEPRRRQPLQAAGPHPDPHDERLAVHAGYCVKPPDPRDRAIGTVPSHDVRARQPNPRGRPFLTGLSSEAPQLDARE